MSYSLYLVLIQFTPTHQTFKPKQVKYVSYQQLHLGQVNCLYEYLQFQSNSVGTLISKSFLLQIVNYFRGRVAILKFISGGNHYVLKNPPRTPKEEPHRGTPKKNPKGKEPPFGAKKLFLQVLNKLMILATFEKKKKILLNS